MHDSSYISKPALQKILFICGSNNQTTMMHEIYRHLKHHDCYFTPYYSDGIVGRLAGAGLLDFTILGRKHRDRAYKYLVDNNLQIDENGAGNDYDLVFTCSDLIVPKNISGKKLILVQEGMTNPPGLGYYLVKYLNFPTYIGDTTATGLSDAYDVFCVASEGYKEHFISIGVKPEKIRVTGIPNYDNCELYRNNRFPYNNYVLVATSDARETLMWENRKKFLNKVADVASGRLVIFKLHPNEIVPRAVREIKKWMPGEYFIVTGGNVHEMIANCDALVTHLSTVVFTGIALGKEVYSYYDIEYLKRLAPVQNGGVSAENIALEAVKILSDTAKVLHTNGTAKKEKKAVKLRI